LIIWVLTLMGLTISSLDPTTVSRRVGAFITANAGRSAARFSGGGRAAWLLGPALNAVVHLESHIRAGAHCHVRQEGMDVHNNDEIAISPR
jgi:hypothetical protein